MDIIILLDDQILMFRIIGLQDFLSIHRLYLFDLWLIIVDHEDFVAGIKMLLDMNKGKITRLNKWFHRIPLCSRDKIILEFLRVQEFFIDGEFFSGILFEDVFPRIPTLRKTKKWNRELIGIFISLQHLISSKWIFGNIPPALELVQLIEDFLRVIDSYSIADIHQGGRILLIIMEKIEDISVA